MDRNVWLYVLADELVGRWRLTAGSSWLPAADSIRSAAAERWKTEESSTPVPHLNPERSAKHTDVGHTCTNTYERTRHPLWPSLTRQNTMLFQVWSHLVLIISVFILYNHCWPSFKVYFLYLFIYVCFFSLSIIITTL